MTARRDRFDERHRRKAGVAQQQHRVQMLRRRLGLGLVALVDDEDVGDLEGSGLDRLHAVAEARRTDDQLDVSDVGNRHVGLSGADGLDDDEIGTGRVHDLEHPLRGAGQAASLPT